MDFELFLNHLVALLKRIGLILLLFTLTRLLFFIYNLSVFKPLDAGLILKSFFYGVRFDFIAIFYPNIILIFFHLFCFKWTEGILFQKILKGLFIFVNTVLFLFNVIDIAYFKYTGKRSGWEMIEMLNTSSDTKVMIPKYVIHYWYMVLILIALIFILVRFYPKLKAVNLASIFTRRKNRLLSYCLAVILLGCAFLYARGIETKPVRMITANRYVTPTYIPLLLNTPFTIINTINQHPEKLNQYFPVEENIKIYSSLRQPEKSDEFKRMNVVIIILESFGKEYVETKTEEGQDFTPFLDSLQSIGLYCDNAYANALRSIDALPPILGGFPSLLRTSFIGSAYSISKLRGLPSILKDHGYSTSFYHGGRTGTMGFDMFCNSIDIDSYYGREEYNNEKDYDGGWGIWDEEFLQYMANNLNRTREPFFSTVFTLTSHDPYPLPKKYTDSFFPDQPKILQTIAYTDFALRKFFETASTMKWFRNTLFVICPDHTSIILNSKYNSRPLNISIPIIYYCPSDTTIRGVTSKVTQQLDIMPTILDYLNYDKSFVSFGKSIFEEGYRFSVNFNEVNYQIIDSSYYLLFDGGKVIEITKYRDANPISSNSPGSEDEINNRLENNLKAFLDDYYFRLNNNLLADTIEIDKYKIPTPGF